MVFRAALDELFDQQRARLLASLDSEGAARVDEAFDALVDHHLDVESIDQSLCTELKLVLVRRYEHPIASTRLEGYGWTVAHVKDHMRRLLKSKMQQAGTLMRSIVMQDEQAPAKRARHEDSEGSDHHDEALDEALELRLEDVLAD